MITVDDIENIQNVTQKALKVDQKEQRKLSSILKSAEPSPKKLSNIPIYPSFDPNEVNLSNTGDIESIKSDLISLITEKVNDLEDKNVKD